MESDVLNGPKGRAGGPGREVGDRGRTRNARWRSTFLARQYRAELVVPAAAGVLDALTATEAEEPVVPASEMRALQTRIRELRRWKSEILKETLKVVGSKKYILQSLSWPKDGSEGGVKLDIHQYFH